ncbi:MAG TPA: sulfur carrier protein ThiS [Acidimicrobiales bacterium]|nr:sulfur carrier protein ThiS [Acidimicrobiales bacterium]
MSAGEPAGRRPTTGPRCTVNGEATQLPVAATVEDVLAGLLGTLPTARRGIAVALNAEVVPRSAWPRTPIGDGDRVEVLTVAQGG